MSSDVYLAKTRISGMMLQYWYDITDYESFSSGSRRGKSPLGFLTFMTNNTLRKDGIQELLYWTPFQHWFSIKHLSNLPWIFVWAMYRIIICTLTMILMVDTSLIENHDGDPDNRSMLYPNSTVYLCLDYTTISISQSVLPYLAGFVCLYGIAGLLYDVCELFYVLVNRKPEFMLIQLKNGNVSISFWFFRVTQSIYLLVVVIITLPMVQNATNPVGDSIISDMGHLFFVLVAFASLLFFIQQISGIGFYIITIKHLLRDIFYFAVLYVLCATPFLFYFMTFINKHSTHGCVSEFRDYKASFYSMFLVMLNMVNFTDYELHDEHVIYITHIIFIFMVGILLVNFLIAVMSDSAAKIGVLKKTLVRLEKLHALFMADIRISWILKRYYTYVIKKIAVVNDGRIYVIDVQKIKN